MAEHVLQDALQQLGALSPLLFDASQHLRTHLAAPPRIVIVGRVKSGKSTLLNALVGAPVAETAALEATNVVTVYQHGAPDRAEAVLKSGSTVPVTTRRGAKAELPVPAADVAYVNRWMPVGAIAQHTLIDTPGLATLTTANAAATEGALLDGFGGGFGSSFGGGLEDGFEQTRRASVDADAAVFLFDTAPHQDEIDFLTRLGFGSFNTLGVLARADAFDDGALGVVDPLDAAAEHAKRLAAQLSQYVHTVVPVAGLLAETALTGQVTEQFARQVAALAPRSDESLVEAFLSGATADEALAGIVDKVGEYGLFRGRAEAAKGAVGFTEWLVARSGLEELRLLIDGPLSHFASLQRTARVIEKVERLAFEHPEHQREIRRLVSDVTAAPEMTDVALLLAQRTLLSAAPRSEVTHEVTAMLAASKPAQRVGLSADASPWEILEAVRIKREWAQNLSFGLLDPAEEHALLVVGRALDQVERYAQSLT